MAGWTKADYDAAYRIGAEGHVGYPNTRQEVKLHYNKSVITPILQNRWGYDEDHFSIMDESNNGPEIVDRNEMRVQLFIQPTRTAEFIILDFNILATGASFSS